MGSRYFGGTAMGGRLFIQGIIDNEPWDAARLAFLDEEVVNMVYHPLAGDRKVQTAEQLLGALLDSKRAVPSIKLWILEGLETDARRLAKGAMPD